MLYHILAVGDVVGEPGLKHLERHLRPLKKLKAIDFTVVNGENASGVGTVGNAVCGDIMRIYLDIDDETQVIKDAKFKTFGCGAAIATSSMATEMIIGKTVQEALQVTNKAVMEALDGLPKIKVHCSLLAEESIHAALWDYAEKHGIVIEGLEKPKEDVYEDASPEEIAAAEAAEARAMAEEEEKEDYGEYSIF